MKVFSVVIVSVLTPLSQQQLAQKCLTHLERDLEALKLSRFESNRFLAIAVAEILTTARTLYRDYQASQLSRERWQPLLEVATELSQRLIRTFLKDAKEVDTTDF